MMPDSSTVSSCLSYIHVSGFTYTNELTLWWLSHRIDIRDGGWKQRGFDLPWAVQMAEHPRRQQATADPNVSFCSVLAGAMATSRSLVTPGSVHGFTPEKNLCEKEESVSLCFAYPMFRVGWGCTIVGGDDAELAWPCWVTTLTFCFSFSWFTWEECFSDYSNLFGWPLTMCYLLL